MEIALYCPLCGYYEKKRDTTGRRGDFYTSVSVGPVFGELLGFQFAEWLEQSGVQTSGCKVIGAESGRFSIVEAGAHDGRLARDILNWMRLRRPELLRRIEYWIVEPSARRQEWQRQTLNEFAPDVRWFRDFSAFADDSSGGSGNRPSVCRVIFANELLDALPVHRFGWDARRHEWFEWGVTLLDDQFVWTRLDNPSAPRRPTSIISSLPRELLDVLPDGFTTEICPAAETWWRQAAGVLEQGKLLTLDYGLTAGEFFAPSRANGTLRAYRGHHLADNPLAHPGELDLTAHVNLTAIQCAGESVGLTTESCVSQAQFLTAIAQRAWQDGSNFGEWTKEHTRQFQTLTHPEHLGRAFRVLLQSRNGA